MLPPSNPCHATITQVTAAPCPHGVTWQCGRVPFTVHLLRLDLVTTYCGADPDAPGGYAVAPGMGGATCGACGSQIGLEAASGQAPTKPEVDAALARWHVLHPPPPAPPPVAEPCGYCDALASRRCWRHRGARAAIGTASG